MSKLNIYACSGVGSADASNVARNIQDSGWYRDETLRRYLGSSTDGGGAEYFLYIFIPERDLAKYNATIYRKRKQQLKTYNYVKELFVGYNYGTEQELRDIIRSGIETTFGSPVEAILDEIRTGKRESIGIATEIICAIITSIVSIVIAVVSGVISYATSVKVAKYTAPTMQEIAESAPAETDILGGIKKNGFAWGAIIGAGLLLFGTLKNRK